MFTRSYRFRTLKAVLIISGLVACDDPPPVNHYPSIEIMTASPDSLVYGQTSQLMCSASDADGDALSYDWNSYRGEFDGDGPQVEYTAPYTPGRNRISVTVTDVHGAQAVESVYVQVFLAATEPEEPILEVDAELDCIKLPNATVAHFNAGEDSYDVRVLASSAHWSPVNSFTRLFLVTEADQQTQLGFAGSKRINAAEQYGIYAFFTEGGVLGDNSGSTTLELTGVLSGITHEWVISATEHCLATLSLETAELTLPAGEFLLWAYSHTARYSANDLYGELFMVPNHGEGVLMDLSNIAELQLTQTGHVSAFFVDPYKIGDNWGSARIVFE